MNYIEWNNAIASYFFCPEHTEQFVYLYVDKPTIIRIGLENGEFQTREAAWYDFLDAVKSGIPGSPKTSDMLKKAIYSYHSWKRTPVKIGEIETRYPLYIAYLALFVIPLTDSVYASRRSSEYYPRFEKFAQKWSLRKLNYQHENYNWNALWSDLEDWTFNTKNMDLGVFDDRDYTNKNWIYVGKALAQCLLPLKTLKNLGSFFQSVGLTPGENISRKKLRQLLLYHSKKGFHLGPDVYSALKIEGNEKGETVIDIVKQEFDKWQGSSDVNESESGNIIKGWTVARVFTIMDIEEGWDENVSFSYRIFSQHDFPDDLNFDSLKCINSTGNWSKALKLKNNYYENIELKDNYNKWIARLPDNPVRIFVSGSRFNLNGWVETEFLIPGRRMYLLVKEELKEAILDWNPQPEELTILDKYEGVPDKYVLFHILNPQKSHSTIEELTLKSDVTIQLNGGLNIARRTWLDVLLPEVLIDGAPDNSQVYLHLKGSNEKIKLIKKTEVDPIWLLPDGLPQMTEFHIKLEGKKVKGDHLPYQLISYKDYPPHFSEDCLPMRDMFGNLVDKEMKTYAIGSHVTGMNYKKQLIYNYNFVPVTRMKELTQTLVDSLSVYPNLLLYYLSIKREASAKEYFDALENIINYSGQSSGNQNQSSSISDLKRTSLQMLDYLGFIDYEYSTRRIVVNPPQLIFIPTKAGRKLILIGGRTPELVETVIQKSKEYNFYPIIEPQHPSNGGFYLPDRVQIVVLEINRDNDIVKFAEECNLVLKVNPKSIARFEYSQFGLLEFSGYINELEQQIEPENQFPGTGWVCKIFNPEKLSFERALENEIERSFQLVEYKVNEYTFLHRLWKAGKAFPVNKNWGRYMVLKHYGKHVIFYDKDTGLFAVPASVPLPRLMMEGIILCSGFAPVKVWLKIEEYETYWHIFDNVPSNLVYNEFQKIGQRLRETKIPYKHEESHRVI